MLLARTVPPNSPRPNPGSLSGTEQILATLANADPAKFTSFFHRVRQAHPEEVTRIALRQIAAHPDNSAAREMADWLAARSAYVPLLFNPDFLSLEEARRAIKAIRASDQCFAAKLFRIMEQTTAVGSLVRALTLMEDIGDYSAFYPRLCTLTWHPDNFVRSRAVLALCRMRPNRPLIDRQLTSADARVRANAIEALWYAPQGSAVEIFLKALADDHHRVVVNALIGLYHHQDASYYEKMAALTKHPEPRFRLAIAWALGTLPEARVLPLLEKLAADSSPDVRSRAASSLARLSQNALSSENPAPAPATPVATETTE